MGRWRKRLNSDFSIRRHMEHGLHYYENLQKVLDARAPQQALRRQIIANRDKLNYQLEYDRIRPLGLILYKC